MGVLESLAATAGFADFPDLGGNQEIVVKNWNGQLPRRRCALDGEVVKRLLGWLGGRVPGLVKLEVAGVPH